MMMLGAVIFFLGIALGLLLALGISFNWEAYFRYKAKMREIASTELKVIDEYLKETKEKGK